ncbi:hypothetical protein LMG26846_02906 [Achromobacter insuavis]|nr:hypothetical protein LMG26846_02906 [Achromobacter insuavis]
MAAGRVDQRLRGHGALAAVVPAQHGDAVGRAAALARQRLHGVARFGRRGALEADAAARGLGVLDQVAAVGEQLHHVARGHAFVFQHGPAQAGLGQQAHQEVIVGLAVLGGVGTRRQVGQRAFDVGRDAVDIALIAIEHMAHDVQHGLALEHAAGAPLRRQPQPRHDGQPVARQAGVARQQLGLADHAAAPGLAAVGARGPQGHRARDHVLQRQPGVIRQRHHPQLADAGKRLARDPALHLQRREHALALQAIEARLGIEQAAAHGCLERWNRVEAGTVKGLPCAVLQRGQREITRRLGPTGNSAVRNMQPNLGAPGMPARGRRQRIDGSPGAADCAKRMRMRGDDANYHNFSGSDNESRSDGRLEGDGRPGPAARRRRGAPCADQAAPYFQ